MIKQRLAAVENNHVGRLSSSYSRAGDISELLALKYVTILLPAPIASPEREVGNTLEVRKEFR